MQTANQIPLIYNLLNNMNSNLNNLLDDPSENTNEIVELSEGSNFVINDGDDLFKYLKNETEKIFKSFGEKDILHFIQANIFSNFHPQWKNLGRNEKNKLIISRDNIYNSYLKISNIYKRIKNHTKIKENSKSKIILNCSIYKCHEIFNMPN
jgi:hypothetical protein